MYLVRHAAASATPRCARLALIHPVAMFSFAFRDKPAIFVYMTKPNATRGIKNRPLRIERVLALIADEREGN